MSENKRGSNILTATSARQQALARGDKYYMSEELCFSCGKQQMRPTDTGECPCAAAGNAPLSTHQPAELSEFCPYLFREQAAALGFRQYGRSITPCHQDHTPTRRWTDSGRCVACSMGL